MEIVKFGGTSVATAASIQLCAKIVLSSKKHQVVVVSAPGKGGAYSTKVTDDLIKVSTGTGELTPILARYRSLSQEILSPEKQKIFKAELDLTEAAINAHHDDAKFIISRGEYLFAKLFALYLDYNFVDAADILVINPNAKIDLSATAKKIRQQHLRQKFPFVIGGFYGQSNGDIALFSRGGSDYTGAILAVLLHAALYKNYTDTNGIQTADPNLVFNTRTIPCLDFDSLDLLTHHGAGIIHENVAQLLKAYRVPLRVDNTFDPNKKFTEVHSIRCRNCLLNFFCVTQKNNEILVVQKKNHQPIKMQMIHSTPETLVTDLQKIHLSLVREL